MKTKQISALLLVPALVVSALSALVLPADTAAALTNAEKKECYEKWAGGYTGTAGDKKKLTSAQFENFKKSKCHSENKGSCKILPYEDGSAIQCQRKDCKYDDGSAGYNGTKGGGSGDTGDDGTDDSGNESGGEDTGDDGSFTGTNQVEGDDCGGVETAFIKCDAGNSGTTEDNGIWALLLMAVNILTAGVGILAVGGIVYGAILYTTAEDKADQVKKATDIITNVVIGLVMFGLMWAGLNFIVPGGVFQ